MSGSAAHQAQLGTASRGRCPGSCVQRHPDCLPPGFLGGEGPAPQATANSPPAAGKWAAGEEPESSSHRKPLLSETPFPLRRSCSALLTLGKFTLGKPQPPRPRAQLAHGGPLHTPGQSALCEHHAPPACETLALPGGLGATFTCSIFKAPEVTARSLETGCSPPCTPGDADLSSGQLVNCSPFAEATPGKCP